LPQEHINMLIRYNEAGNHLWSFYTHKAKWFIKSFCYIFHYIVENYLYTKFDRLYEILKPNNDWLIKIKHHFCP